MNKRSPFRYYRTSPEIIRLAAGAITSSTPLKQLA
jgi:hypothetical protein